MVILLNVIIKTIRGDEFNVEIDRDADVLGLKVQIWELRQIAVENQRLVFAGKELIDSVHLTDAGIDNFATIFMVETVSQNNPPQEASVVNNESCSLIENNNGSAPISIPLQAINSRNDVLVGFESVEPAILAREKEDAVYDLAKWIRVYILSTGYLCVVIAAFCPHGGHLIIPIFASLLGWMGTRNLCRCLIITYSIYISMFAFFLTVGGIFGAIREEHYRHYRYHDYRVGWLIGLIFIGLLHWCIFACLVKLIRNIKRLNADQKQSVRERINQRVLC